ncbi:MAG: hypothetical protein V2J24_05705 [Pseudomonadales bacterium]|jgi:hypothetical protein|nr:hypothetical protein [Pseudomonadales bacterium]
MGATQMMQCMQQPWTRRGALRAVAGFALGFALSYSAEGAFEEDGIAQRLAPSALAELLPRASMRPRIVDILL